MAVDHEQTTSCANIISLRMRGAVMNTDLRRWGWTAQRREDELDRRRDEPEGGEDESATAGIPRRGLLAVLCCRPRLGDEATG